MWYALGFLLLLALANAFVFSFQTGQTVSYSDFKTLVREGKVQEVTVAEDRIRGVLKQPGEKGRNFTAIMVPDQKLTEELDKAGVKYTGEVPNRWLHGTARLGHPDPLPDRPVELLLPPHGWRRRRCHVLRAQPRQDLFGR